jgi:hypothetical protein
MTFNISLKPIQFGAANDDRFEVFPTVENPTSTEGTDAVELLVGGTVRDSRTLTLSPGSKERVTLAWTVDVANSQELSVTVQTSSDSASDEATFRLYDDVLRVRFDRGTRQADINAEQTFVESTDNIGVDAQ